MVTKQINYQEEIPIKISESGDPQINKLNEHEKQEPPLTMLLEQAKLQIIHTTNRIMQEYKLPAVMMDGIISGVLAEIRAQASAELLIDLQNQMKTKQKVGEEIG